VPGKTFSGSLQAAAAVRVIAGGPVAEGRCRTSYPAPARRSRERRGVAWCYCSAPRRAAS